MQIVTFQVFGESAYRSEPALFRHVGVTAADALQIEAPADARELYRVDGCEVPFVTHDMMQAWKVFVAERADSLVSVRIAA
jgi:hypothetical protein